MNKNKRVEQVLSQVTESLPLSIADFMVKYKCSNEVCKAVYKHKGWKTAREQKRDEIQGRIDNAAKWLKENGRLSLGRVIECFGLTGKQVRQAYELSGLPLPNKHQQTGDNMCRDKWPQACDSMNGMKSLNGLKMAWR